MNNDHVKTNQQLKAKVLYWRAWKNNTYIRYDQLL